MLKFSMISITFAFCLAASATTTIQPELFQEIDEKVVEMCKDQKNSSDCRQKVSKCMHEESEEFPMDALEALERCTDQVE